MQVNKLYYANIFIGSNEQTLKMLFDTTSSVILKFNSFIQWLLIPKKGCQTCKGNTFNPSTSKTYKELTKAAEYLMVNLNSRLYF